jgi:hypothetical protein
MYLSEEKRAEIRKCIEKLRSNSGKDKTKNIQGFCDTEDSRKVSQILFDARDGKEVFTPL